jgi:MFS family permease
MYQAQDRGKSLAIAGLLPFLGMALGPIVGGLATQRLRWPWLFWILSCLDAVCLVLGYFVLEETYGPAIARKGPESTDGGEEADKPQCLKILVQGLMRPLHFLFLRPVMTLCTIAAGAKFGVYTLILSVYASLWIDQYHQSNEMASLHYISISLGTIIGALVGGRLMDFIWRRMNERAGAHGATAPPEYRVPHMVIGAIPAILFLLLFGWAGHLHWHWLIVDMSIALFSLADCIFFQGLLAYIVDEFGSKRAASADAAMRLLSYTVGFAFPIFAPSLEKTFGYGVGISILCVALTVVFIVMLPVLWFYGDRLRAVGRRAEDT